MVNVNELLESEFVSVGLVQSSPTKKLVVMDRGKFETTPDKTERYTFMVSIDGKIKKWRPNKPSLEACKVFSVDTMDWVNKLVDLSIENFKGRDCVVGRPAKV